MNLISKFEKLRSHNHKEKKFQEQRIYSKLFTMVPNIFYLLLMSSLLLIIILKVDGSILKEYPDNEIPSYELPKSMIGLCNGTCVPNKAYPCIYSKFYPVSFTKDGKWRWDSPYVNKSGVEVGVGKIIGMPDIKLHTEDGWKVTWYGGNQIISDTKKRIHCACYHVAGKAKETSWMFHSFQIKIIRDGKNQSIDQACGSFTGCPKTKEKAFAQLVVDPYIEKYLGCIDI